MKLIERYVYRKILNAFLLSLVVLASTVWLTQALREFDLVSAQGQTILAFFQMTLLLLPGLTSIVAPVALMIAVIYTFTSLNDGSELVVINASGARQWSLLKPVLIVALGASVFMAAMTLYFSPLSLRTWREMITNVRGSVLTSILKEGQFMSLAPGLTFQLRSRGPDGTLRGIFLSDSREANETVTYVAEHGKVLDSPLGMFLVMSDGPIQRTNATDKTIAIIQFTSYAFDLSSFSSRSEVKVFKPIEQPTLYLLNPSRNDRQYQKAPEKYLAEFHSRMTTPLNALVFALVPIVFMAQAETTRQSRGATIGLAVSTVIGAAVLQFVLAGAAEGSTAAVVAMYALPLAIAGLSIALVLLGIQLKPPERILMFFDRVAARLKGLFRFSSPSPAMRRG
ncbi:MAG TPA: LPS export ABC transporter permease LptF [Bauldia sp.]|nr:LPS export ABC transporter permease LptF [Bauldia sp.]